MTGHVVTHREARSVSSPRLSPSMRNCDPVTLERGVIHDSDLATWTNLISKASKDAEESLADLHKDITVEVLDDQGVVAEAYIIYRCWVSEYIALPELDANRDELVFETLVLQNEGWESNVVVSEPEES